MAQDRTIKIQLGRFFLKSLIDPLKAGNYKCVASAESRHGWICVKGYTPTEKKPFFLLVGSTQAHPFPNLNQVIK